jgi:hypothetical protein
VEGDHVVVVVELTDLHELRLGPVPGVLVVQHHRPPVQGLQLRGVLGAVDDVLEPVGLEVGVVAVEPEREVARVRQALGHCRLQRGQLGGVVLTLAEDVEQDVEDPVLGLAVGACRQSFVGALDGGDLAIPLLPRRHDGEEHVVAATRYVAPAGGTLLIHRQGVATHPEHVQGDVTHQLIATLVGALLDAPQDVGPVGRLGLEVTSDDRVELLQAVHGRQVELGHEVGREHDSVVSVQKERLHHRSCSMGMDGGRNGHVPDAVVPSPFARLNPRSMAPMRYGRSS